MAGGERDIRQKKGSRMALRLDPSLWMDSLDLTPRRMTLKLSWCPSATCDIPLHVTDAQHTHTHTKMHTRAHTQEHVHSVHSWEHTGTWTHSLTQTDNAQTHIGTQGHMQRQELQCPIPVSRASRTRTAQNRCTNAVVTK
jgi:hypothetical protein